MVSKHCSPSTVCKSDSWALCRNKTFLQTNSPVISGLHFLCTVNWFRASFSRGSTRAAKSMDICRAGGVHLFEVTPDSVCHEINVGSTEFGSEYTMISEHRLTAGSYFVMVSHDAFSAMELSSGDFAEVDQQTLMQARAPNFCSLVYSKRFIRNYLQVKQCLDSLPFFQKENNLNSHRSACAAM
jgi:hypothetical protein